MTAAKSLGLTGVKIWGSPWKVILSADFPACLPGRINLEKRQRMGLRLWARIFWIERSWTHTLIFRQMTHFQSLQNSSCLDYRYFFIVALLMYLCDLLIKCVFISIWPDKKINHYDESAIVRSILLTEC